MSMVSMMTTTLTNDNGDNDGDIIVDHRRRRHTPLKQKSPTLIVKCGVSDQAVYP